MGLKNISDLLRVSTVILGVYLIWMESPVTGGFVVLTAAVSFLLKMRQNILITPSRGADLWELLIILLFLSNSIVLVGNFYNTTNVDLLLHFWGGVMIGWWAVLAFGRIAVSNSAWHIILLLGVVALLGVGWEFFEWVFDHSIGARRGLPIASRSVSDLLSDLLMDLLGGIAAVLVWLRQRVRT